MMMCNLLFWPYGQSYQFLAMINSHQLRLVCYNYFCMSDHSQHNSDHQSNTDNCKVYISNINKTIEEDDIKRKFSQFGVIKSLILKKKENNVTYSFIQYEKPSEARAAIAEMDKKTYFDRILKVQYGKGGHRGLEHYHTNRYDKLKDNRHGGKEHSDYKKRSPSERYSSYSSRGSYYERHRDRRSPRVHQRRDRREYDRRERSRSYQRRDYRDKEYSRDDRYKDRRDYDKESRRYYDERRYRDHDRDKYGHYQRDDKRDDYPNRSDKDRQRTYERSPPRTNKYQSSKDGDRYSKQIDRYQKDPIRHQKDDRYKERDRHSKEKDYYKQGGRYIKDQRYGKEGDRYAKQPQRQRYDKYSREGQYKDYKRDGYERRKQYVREQLTANRKDSKQYQQSYQSRPSNSYDKPRVQAYSRTEER